MVKRERLREWWRSLWIDETINPESLAQPYAAVLERLDKIEARLAALERRQPTPPANPAPPTDLDCGHHSGSYATFPDGQTECMRCYSRRF